MADEIENAFLAEEAPAEGLGLDGKVGMPSLEEILEMIDKASSLTEEEKIALKQDLFISSKNMNEAAAAGGIFATGNLLFIGLLSLVAFIIGFFVYKLLKTEMDKQKSREQKKLAREQRKNKHSNKKS